MLLGIHGEVKLADFGVAKARSRSYHTMSGTIKGKAPYMAPEQILGEPLDRRADVFGARRPPVRGHDAHAAVLGASDAVAMKQILDGDVPDPADAAARLSARARRDRRGARSPAIATQRYPTARALVDDLDQLAQRAALVAVAHGASASSSRAIRAIAPRRPPGAARVMRAERAPTTAIASGRTGCSRRSAPAARRGSISRASIARTASSATS